MSENSENLRETAMRTTLEWLRDQMKAEQAIGVSGFEDWISPIETALATELHSDGARRDANGDPIPWAKEHDYFMGFDPDNPDIPTD